MVRWSLALITVALGVAILGTAAAAGGGCHSQDTSTSQARGTAVEITACKFAPVVLFAPVGATVSWAQSDVVPHNVVGLGWGDSRFMDSGSARVTNAFMSPGIYPYHCTLHADMSGVVIVGDIDLTGAAAPAGSLALAPPTPAPPTPAPTALVASAATQPSPDRMLLAAGIAALAIAGLAGFAMGRGPKVIA